MDWLRIPSLDLAQINSELALFDPQLGQKPQIVALNKMDLPEVRQRWPDLQKELKRRGHKAAGYFGRQW
jgi:GTPase